VSALDHLILIAAKIYAAISLLNWSLDKILHQLEKRGHRP
jgi:hypothetical protein